jgi:glycine cleavage system H protein
MNAGSENPVIPEGELHCIWMDAGLVGYKLCDRQYQCDGCLYDTLIRVQSIRHISPGPNLTPDRTGEAASNGSGRSPADPIEQILERSSASLRSLALRDDRLYHLNHTWIYNDRIESVTVGIDHIAAFFLKPVVGIVLPQIPTHVEQNAPCIWIVMREGTITLRSPVSGTIIRVNKRLRDHPSLVSTDPYNEGWILHIAPNDIAASLEHVRSSSRAVDPYSHDLKSLYGAFRENLHRHFDGVGATLADGGIRLDDLQDILGPQKYYEIISSVFTGK